jgi:hypothetical protein
MLGTHAGRKAPEQFTTTLRGFSSVLGFWFPLRGRKMWGRRLFAGDLRIQVGICNRFRDTSVTRDIKDTPMPVVPAEPGSGVVR